MTCYATANVAAPCAVCREPAVPVHIVRDAADVARLLCGQCCPIHKSAEHLSGPVETVRGEQKKLF